TTTPQTRKYFENLEQKSYNTIYTYSPPGGTQPQYEGCAAA
ncbi:MAG: hypothetical protein RIR65_1972, partial [Planctomycetota bacterium]